MKPFQVMLCTFLLCSVTASAQRKTEATNNNTNKSDATVKGDATVQTPSTERIGTLLTFDQLDQRRIYRWENGQSATPSGREAGGTIGKYVRVFGDSVVVVKDPMLGKERELTKNQ